MTSIQPIVCIDPADEPLLSPQARRFWNSLKDQSESASADDSSVMASTAHQ
jgi:hypothetical protein